MLSPPAELRTTYYDSLTTTTRLEEKPASTCPDRSLQKRDIRDWCGFRGVSVFACLGKASASYLLSRNRITISKTKAWIPSGIWCGGGKRPGGPPPWLPVS